MINPSDLLDLAVIPALERLEMDSPAARALLMGTAAVESRLTYLRQHKGPAIGLWQMEPATFRWLWDDWIPFRPFVHSPLLNMVVSPDGDPMEMAWNLRFAAAMARIRYRIVSEPLPDAEDLDGLAAYWKRFYNTFLGAGSIEHFRKSYELVRPALERAAA